MGEYREDFRLEGGIAVPAGAARPDITTADALRSALLTADALYLADPERATAGIHFVKVLRQLGIDEQFAARCRTFPNSATAMRELAAAGSMHSLGCTQITEINYTEGVALVGPLPDDFELSTPYVTAVTQRCAQPVASSLPTEWHSLRGLNSRREHSTRVEMVA